MKTLVRTFTLAASLGFLIVLAPPVSAHGFSSAGVAFLDNEVGITAAAGASVDLGAPAVAPSVAADSTVYHVFFDASFDPFGTMACRLIIKSPFDLENPVVDAAFTIETNFADSHDVPVVNPDFWAKSASTGVDFQLNGTQLRGQIQATGHYENYRIELTFAPGTQV